MLFRVHLHQHVACAAYPLELTADQLDLWHLLLAQQPAHPRAWGQADQSLTANICCFGHEMLLRGCSSWHTVFAPLKVYRQSEKDS